MTVGQYTYPELDVFEPQPVILMYRFKVIILGIILSVIAQGLLKGFMGSKLGIRPFFECVFDSLLSPMIIKLNRNERSERALLFRGFVLMIVCGFLVGLLTYLDLFIPYQYRDVLIIALCVSPLTPVLNVISFARNKDDAKEQNALFLALSKGSGTNLIHHDDQGLNRHVIRILSLGFVQYVIGPCLAFFILKDIGLFLYVFANVIINASGRANLGGSIAWMARMIIFPINYIGQYIALFFLYLASLALGHGNLFKNAANIFALFKFKKASVFEGGSTLGIMSLALGKTLGGPYQDRYGKGVSARWVGKTGSSAQIKKSDVLRASFITLAALVMLLIFGIIVISSYSPCLYALERCPGLSATTLIPMSAP